jgi:hypothetical protein
MEDELDALERIGATHSSCPMNVGGPVSAEVRGDADPAAAVRQFADGDAGRG